jgi:hypothetical protein
MREKQPGFTPTPPEVEARYRFDRNGNYIDELGRRVDERFGARPSAALPPADAFAELIAKYLLGSTVLSELIEQAVERLYARFRKEFADYIDQRASLINGDYLYCDICSHDGCAHHHGDGPYSRKALEEYLPTTKSTIYSRLHRKEMPPPVSGPPYEWNPHAAAAYKFDKVVFANGHYDRDEHLRLLETVREERAKKRAATSEKRSENMKKENAKRREAKRQAAKHQNAKPNDTTSPTATTKNAKPSATKRTATLATATRRQTKRPPTSTVRGKK